MLVWNAQLHRQPDLAEKVLEGCHGWIKASKSLAVLPFDDGTCLRCENRQNWSELGKRREIIKVILLHPNRFHTDPILQCLSTEEGWKETNLPNIHMDIRFRCLVVLR